ncbi:MAG: ABC transporter permease subunit, partial [Oscillospiraceae bacterium]|nr:ABC transporter permease subunit [Oscillospiraceae bacterium]
TALSEKFTHMYPDLKVLNPPLLEIGTAFIFGKTNPELRESFNDFLREIRANGVYDDMAERWLNTLEPPEMPEIPTTGENGKLVFATTGANDVFSFIRNGVPTGFEIEMAHRFAQSVQMELDIQLMDFMGIIPAVDSVRVDFAGSSIAITEERKQSVDFSDVVYVDGLMITVQKDTVDSVLESPGFLESVKTGFERNLIHENRWKMIVDGLCVSIIITISAFALATLLGFGVCGLRMSKNALLKAVGSAYVTILRGTPIVVLLMITFYVIFAKSNINAIAVAVIAFGVNGAAFIGEIIRSAILTVDKGQIEAARSMGFGKIGVFFTVTFPQAVRVAFPVYMSEFISLFKMTSVVGYIAVVDLTKAGDIIRSRTYDAFFPLLFVALVYLAVASIMIWLFGRVERVTNKRLKRAKTKKV